MSRIILDLFSGELYWQDKPKRNPVARDLHTPKYRPRVVKSKKVYSRKGKKV